MQTPRTIQRTRCAQRATQYDAVHSMQANTVTKQVGIAADWWLLTMVDELVAPGSIQAFSGSAWHVSLRADQLKHVDYRGKCLRRRPTF